MELIIQLKTEKTKINEKIKLFYQKQKLLYRKKNKRIICLLDIAIILAIVFNLGAVLITNVLVIKAEPETKFMEMNPAAAEAGNYELHPDSKESFKLFNFLIMNWFFIIAGYLIVRSRIYNNLTLTLVGFYVLYILTGTCLDFFNNFGFILGVWLYA